jgi:iron complex outermembrane receptor protein
MYTRTLMWRFAVWALIGGSATPGFGVKAAAAASDSRSDLVRALEAREPHASLGERALILDGLVGTWDVEYTDFLKDGTAKHASGEFIVGWVLDGYAVQDIYTIDPSEPGKERYISTTLNYLDPKAGTWHAVFIDPAHDYVATFTGVAERPNRIVFQSTAAGGTQLRWTRDIRTDSFVQREEESTDGGQTWKLTAEHHMTRRKPTASAAPAQDNAVKSAADAFGERVGTEQAGLYTESQVRGFDLNESGAYRIDDAYFSRAAALNDPVLAGVGVRVGVNAVRLAYPAPSGVVNYRLRQASATNELRLGAGWRDFGTRVLQGDGSWREGNFSLAGGFVWRPALRLAGGNEGRATDVGGVGTWTLAPNQQLRAFATRYFRSYDGDYAVLASSAAVPPSLESHHQYSPSWARSQAVSSNFGVLYDARLGDYTVDLSAFHSIFDIDRTDYTLISADADGRASATTYRNPDRTKRASSAEVRLGRQFTAAGFDNLATVSLRGGRTAADLTSNLIIPLGTFDLRSGNPSDAVELPWSGTRGEDTVEQITASAGYGLALRDRVQLRFGLHRTRYDKDVLSMANAHTQATSEKTLYNISAIVSLTERTALFSSWVTGLEEAGVAPTSATNRDEVLPPVEAEQFELGVRHTLTPRLTLIGALFDVSKPTNGARVDGSFGLVGEVRHRGIEGSITGQLDDKTSVVLGAVTFEARVTGPLVDAGIVGSRAAGISQRMLNANIERRINGTWSVDAGLSYSGARWADTGNSFKTPAITTLSLGARNRFELAGRSAEFRVLGSNLTGAKGYAASSSGVLTPISPRTVRAMLTLVFSANG